MKKAIFSLLLLAGGINYTLATPVDLYAGQTAWLIKNSWGTDWGTEGYGYVLVGINNLEFSTVEGVVSSLILDDQDIVCSDEDGDGFCFWGASLQPNNLPSWVSQVQDGDDSDPDIGPSDNYGNLMDITITPTDTHICDYTEYSHNNSPLLSENTRVIHSGHLIISNTFVPLANINISVEQNGDFTIGSSGNMFNTNLSFRDTSKFHIKDGGRLFIKRGMSLEIPVGTTFEFLEGEIRVFDEENHHF